MTGTYQTLTIDGTTFSLQVRRKRVKNINVRLVGSELRVSAPPWVPDDDLDVAVEELARRLIRRERARALNSSGDALDLARRVAARFTDPPRINDARFSTLQRARWGSYSARTGTIHLNAALTQMPSWVLEAVVAHELAHTVCLDHSSEFWALVRRVCPETDRARAFLEGVSWLGRNLDRLPSVEREQLVRELEGE